jgi:anaerobic ribonucleoside-triphosphate reductase activating protein
LSATPSCVHYTFPSLVCQKLSTETEGVFVAKQLTKVIDKVIVHYPPEMDEREAAACLAEQKEIDASSQKKERRLVEMEISLAGDEEIIVRPHYDDVRRIRRITGYLSTMPRFNDAKLDEEAQRISHFGNRVDDPLQNAVDLQYKIYVNRMIKDVGEIDNEAIAGRLLQDGYSRAKVINAIARLSPDQNDIECLRQKIWDMGVPEKPEIKKGRSR